MGVVYKSKNVTRCSHCGEICGKDAKFCKDCTRAESRRELCNENVEIFEKKGMKYSCKMCKINV